MTKSQKLYRSILANVKRYRTEPTLILRLGKRPIIRLHVLNGSK